MSLEGKGLFVFSDPGGAKPILSYIRLMELQTYKIISDRIYDFYEDYGLEIHLYTKEQEYKVIEDYAPDFIFTGTSYTSDIELRFKREASKKGIVTVSFIDHYTRYSDRFFLEGQMLFPDKILLTDERALSIAVSEGFDEVSDLQVTGNYQHDFLRSWRPKKKREELFSGVEFSSETRIVCFAPDPLSNVGGKSMYGFDEMDVWNLFRESIMKVSDLEILVVLKFHPNQNKESFFARVTGFEDLKIISTDFSNTNDVVFYSDVVVGMYSSLLVEAKILNTSVVRCLPNALQVDSLSGMGIGVVCQNQEEIAIALNRLLR